MHPNFTKQQVNLQYSNQHIAHQNNGMNNKFYDQYKELFVDQTKTPYIKPSLNNYNTNIPALSSPYTVNKTIKIKQNNNLNSNQNELKNLFKKYVGREFNDSCLTSGKRPLESVASKELSNVILPKLRMYDQEIDNKLKRFKTQHQEQSFVGHNYSGVYQNNYSFLQPNHNYSSVNNRNEYEQQYSRYKHGYKFKTPSNNIFHKEFETYAKINNNNNKSFSNYQPLTNYIKQQPKKPQANSLLDRKHSNNHLSKELNDSKAESVAEKQVNRSRIKRKSPIFYMKHNPQEDLQTQYQRSYSNKKLPPYHEDQHKQLLSSRIVEKSSIIPTNFHQLQKKQQINQYKTPQKQKIKIDNDFKTYSKQKQTLANNNHDHYGSQTHNMNSDNQTPTKSTHNTHNNNNKHHLMTQPSSPQHPSRVKHYHSLRQSRKGSRKYTIKKLSTQQQSVINHKQQGMKFSQYENQYAFINKRLQDIYNFNNFYSHKYINSYKLAIMSRLEAKRKIEDRRNSLKQMLEKETLEYEEGMGEEVE